MKVKWTRRAERSLRLISDYIAKDNPKAAYDTIMRIRAAGNRLAQTPAMGRLGRVEGTRELVVTKNYLIPYRIKDNEIQILHVFHSKRRWPESF